MPFDKSIDLSGGTIGYSEYDTPDPSFLDTLGAALRQENLIGSALTSPRMAMSYGDFKRVAPEYNVYDDIEGYEDHAERFENSFNPQATAAIKAGIDKEKKDRDTLAAAGFTGAALSMGASVVDPTILIPGGALAKTGKVGYSGLKSAVIVGSGAAAGAAAQEVGLQATQETRTATESAINIGGSAILGGLIGYGAAKFLSKGEWQRLSRELEDELIADVPEPKQVAETIIQRMQAAGAQSTEQISLEDLGVGGGRAAQAVARATDAMRLNPGVQTMFSPSVAVRQTYQQLVDNPIYTRMEMDHGKTLGPAVENNVKQLQRGALAGWVKAARTNFKAAKKAGFQGSKTEFYERVARAGRRGDVDELGDEFVTATAKAARENIFDPTLKRLIELGQFPEDIKTTTAASYVTRFWNRQKLIGEEQRFREIARKYFREQIAKVPEADRPDFVSRADMDNYIEDVVTSVFKNLTGKGSGDVPEWLVPLKRGPLKERTFNIPDEMVEEFLENDMEMILRRYVRTVGAETELISKFGRADMRDQFEAIDIEYEELAALAETDADRLKLRALRDRDVKNLEAFRDMIRGTYRAAEEGSEWSQLTRAALTWNYMRLLGGVTLTSITDASRLVAVHGVRATMREAIPALVSNLKAAKIARADARDLGAVTEVILQNRLATLAELQDPYRYGSGYDRFLSNASNIFSKATGLGYWNDGMKTIASVMTQNRMAKNALDWKSASKSEKAYMAFLGIDETMAGRIADQIKAHGVQENNIWGANVSKWNDEQAARTWAAALNKDVDRTIITKGVADTPLWTKTNWGKLIFQFKSFAMASHQRALIAGLQENQLRLLESMVMATSLGMMVGYLKFIERGDFENAQRLIDNPGLWISEGLDRTGLLSIPFEISNTGEKLGLPIGIKTGIQALAQDEDRGGSVSRYAQRNKLGAVLGPSAGLFQDLATIAEQTSKGDLTKGGAGAIIRQIPGGSLPGIRSAAYGFVKPQIQEWVD